MFRLNVETDGAAFKDPDIGEADRAYEEIEISRIMRKVAAELREGKTSGSVMDLNGNKVGCWTREDKVDAKSCEKCH